MCTINVAVSRFEPNSLVVWANRDEALDRPWGPPRVIDGVLAPVDLVAGGTWIGVNRAGVFAGLTNRFTGPPDPSRASRGALVHHVLKHDSLSGAVDEALRINARAYNPFHLVLATSERAAVVWSDGSELHQHDPGSLFAVHERSFGAAPSERQDYLDDILPTLHKPDDDSLLRILSRHHDPTLDGMCVHWDAHNYGTRSSTVLRLGQTVRYLWTEGRPCTTTPTDDSSVLQGLLSEGA